MSDSQTDGALFVAELPKDDVVTLKVLDAIHRNHSVNQRTVAGEIGIALGLTNAYLKRCIKKGYVKVKQAPRNRFLYYITPEGFAEKARLTSEYLSQSFLFFRTAREDCNDVLSYCLSAGHHHLVLAGASDLTHIMLLCASENPAITISAVVDDSPQTEAFAGRPRIGDYTQAEPFDAVVVTDLRTPQATFERAANLFGKQRVLAPKLLKIVRQAVVSE